MNHIEKLEAERGGRRRSLSAAAAAFGLLEDAAVPVTGRNVRLMVAAINATRAGLAGHSLPLAEECE